jgi:hypothetical protein
MDQQIWCPRQVVILGGTVSVRVFASPSARLVIQHPLLTSSYHPQSNGLVEQFHRQLNDGLRARLAGGSGYSISRGSYCAWELPQKRTAHISLAKIADDLTLTLPGEL